MSKKSIFLILALVLIIPSMVYSAAVTQTTAEQVATNWYSERSDKAPNDFIIVESFIETENAENVYYIFNFDKTGFVIVAAEDIAVPILGYVFKHNYTTENHPPQFDAMLASYRDQILYARNNNLSPHQEIVDKWNRLKVTTDMFIQESFRAVGPLLSTTWNQGQYYNEMCPADPASNPGDPFTPGNGYVWAGCTATATAQVMKYHSHPITGEGTHSYTDATYGLQFVNYGTTTYNWVLMPNNVTFLNPSVETLIYHVGVGAEMGYGIYGSGAWIGGAHPATALSTLQNNFKYDPNSYYDQRNNYSATPSVWHTMLKTELDNNRPLVYEGYNSGYSDGHAFVIDGYSGPSNDIYHVNWGWSGSYDGNYTLDALAPLLPNYDYRFYQAALFGVEPRKWRPLPDVSIDVSLLPYTGVDLDLYYEGPVALLSYSVLTDLTGQEFTLTINTNNELYFATSSGVTSDVNIDITIRAAYTGGGTADDTFNFIITGTSSGSTTKWEQLPDLSPTGMDVDATFQPDAPPPLLLADDFNCTETGYITDIHIWGSWLNDYFPLGDPAAVQLKFSIHSDIPAGGAAPWSMPGEVLWWKVWIPGPADFEWIESGPEDWYNPFVPFWWNDNHFMCIKYNCILDPSEYFLQQGTPEDPIIYWLDVQALPMDPEPDCRFGWKTSLDHWNDDAVWAIGDEPYFGPWEELRYPIGHEYEYDSIDLAFQITTEGEPDEYDFGDAPEGANKLAYPSGVTGSFPTCITAGPAGYVQHGFGENWAWFGPMVDIEADGNAGLCPGCFPTYDDDECFNDGDAGLMFPDSYTIDATGSVVTCTGAAGSSLGFICQNATWGVDIDIDVTNNMPVDGFVNVLVDWNQNGQWQNDASTHCAGVTTPEHVLVDFGIPSGHSGSLSSLMAIGSSFQIGPNVDYVWVRFSITESPVGNDWDGSGVFEDGETEDYLLYVRDEEPEELDFGDAPEGDGARAYPSLGVDGMFPTCITVGPSGYIAHGPGPLTSYFGPSVDLELDGNAGACPGCFPAYDLDECFTDGDAGLIIPEPFTIDAAITVVPCPTFAGTSLGFSCATAVWGPDIDIDVQNTSTADRYVNVLFDWNQNGYWLDDSTTQCAGVMTPEHVLINFVVPGGYTGPLSGLTPPSFIIGPNAGYFWSRFTISDMPVIAGEWEGSGEFADGETEDYLILVEEEPEELDFGDAPDPSYPTLLLASDGARHILDGVTYLGASIDSEPDGQPDAAATGDDNDGNDDEDGVLFVSPLIPGEQGAVYIQASVNGLLNAWLDFDANGSWDAGEQIFTDVSLISGWNSLNFTVLTSAIPGNTFARFRFDTGGGLGVTGLADDGEVEDYRVMIDEDLHDGLKMHYHQWPDTTSFGVDVCVMQELDMTRIVADDFLCVETGPINSIHIWGSWKYDEIILDNVIFDLAIWSDNPVGPFGWSEPETLLWEKQFVPGEYNESVYYDTPNGEWWYDPCFGEFIFPGDYIVWEYDFIIPDADAFFQEEDTIYWLSVRAHFVEPYIEQFGWKSSVNHWNDDAVYQCNYPFEPWTELIYPFPHPFNPTNEEHVSMDMAFYIDCHPSNPVNFIISKVGTNITLQWDPVLCASYYNVYSSTDPYAAFPGGWTLEATGTHITTTTWNDPVSTAGSKKFYRVTAEN